MQSFIIVFYKTLLGLILVNGGPRTTMVRFNVQSSSIPWTAFQDPNGSFPIFTGPKLVILKQSCRKLYLPAEACLAFIVYSSYSIITLLSRNVFFLFLPYDFQQLIIPATGFEPPTIGLLENFCTHV